MSSAGRIADYRLPLGGTLDAAFARLPAEFYTMMAAEGVGDHPQLVHANAAAAKLIDLDPRAFADPEFAEIFSGHRPLAGFAPLAMVYAGHQFGVWAGQLGDGRALLIGQVRNRAGELWDIQLKGSGKTPYSRFGDGRAVMRSCIREYLCSEAMAALDIPTSRSLALVATGERVLREHPEPGAVLTRLARSHVRFGHFEHFHYQGKNAQVRLLADHAIAEYFPGMTGDYAGWYREIVRRTAHMVAQWQAAGFAHGVMNTDNMSILGLTLDYGPFGFMEAYDPNFICNHTDEMGRYSFINQPAIAHWNLRALAVALSGLIGTDELVAALDIFEAEFSGRYRALMRAKLGLVGEDGDDDKLIGALLVLMARAGADYTLTFRDLPRGGEPWLARFAQVRAEAEDWLARYRARFDGDPAEMDRVNPRYVLRNWVAETAIRAVEDRGDVAVLDRILGFLQSPYEDHPADAEFAAPPPPELCGLEVSCSS
jgi:uncharacterized protein YdiU (UPF0061 family)